MNPTRRNSLIVLGSMVATAMLAQAAKPSRHLADEIGKPNLPTLFPEAFGGWRIDTNMPVVLPAPDVQAKLDAIYNQVLSRTYVNASGERIMLSVAYGGDQSDGTRAHRPEVCYPAQGFQILANQHARIDIGGRSLEVRQLMSRLGGRNEPITYWVVVGDEIATSGWEQRVAEVRYGLRGIVSDGMLVRISNIDADAKRGHALQARFANELSQAMTASGRARVFGKAAAGGAATSVARLS